MNDTTPIPILCKKCREPLDIRTERQDGDNLPPGGLSETFIECPSGCEVEVQNVEIL